MTPKYFGIIFFATFFGVIFGQDYLYAGYIEYGGTSCNSNVDYMYISQVDMCMVMNYPVSELATWRCNTSYVNYGAYSNQQNHVCNATTLAVSVSIPQNTCVYTDELYTCWTSKPNPFDFEPTWDIIVESAYTHNNDCSGSPLYYKVSGMPLCDTASKIKYACSGETLQAFECSSSDCSGQCNFLSQIPSTCTTNNTWLFTIPPTGYTAKSICSYRSPPSPAPSGSVGPSPSSPQLSPSSSPDAVGSSSGTQNVLPVFGVTIAALLSVI